MSDDKPAGKQSGGVNISGGSVNVSGDIVGRDKITYTMIPKADLDRAFQPVVQAVGQNQEAAQKLEALKTEAAKGRQADDGTLAKLVKSLVGLVPSAVSTVVSAFASPILGGVAGPVTKWVLEEIKGE
jgi:hypothetical protein